MNESIQKVIAVLQEQGLAEDEIATLCEDVMVHAYEVFIDEAKMLLTEEDLQQIDKLPEESSTSEIMRVYQQRTGNDPQEVMANLVKQYAKQVMDEYSQASSSDQQVS